MKKYCLLLSVAFLASCATTKQPTFNSKFAQCNRSEFLSCAGVDQAVCDSSFSAAQNHCSQKLKNRAGVNEMSPEMQSGYIQGCMLAATSVAFKLNITKLLVCSK
jgi:hypothetical protein